MPKLNLKKSVSPGFTLVEIGVTLAVIAILVTYGVVSYQNTGEYRDAVMVGSAQASLQSIVSQGAARMNVRPDQLNSQSVLSAFQGAMSQKQTGGDVDFNLAGNSYQMTIKGTRRQASFDVSPTGNVRVTGLSGFTKYKVDKSSDIWTIQKES